MLKSMLVSVCRGVDVVVMLAGRLASYLVPVLAFVVAFEVFARYVFNQPTIWAYDLSLFLFGYVAALGGAYAQQKRSHITVDILYLRVSPNTRRVFNLVTYSLGIFFLLVLVYVSFGKYQEAIEFGYKRQSEWAPPMFHFWVMLQVAGVLFIAQLARDMVDDLYHLVTGEPLMPAGESDDEY